MIRTTVRLLRPLHHQRRVFLSSTTATPLDQICQKQELSKTSSSTIKSLLDKHKDTIHYSSYLQSFTLTWSEQQVANRFERKQKQAEIRENIRLKPISLAAQLLNDPPIGETQNDSDLKVQDDLPVVVKEKVQNESYGQLAESRVNSSEWMRDYESYEESEEDDDLGVYGTPDPSKPVSNAPCYGCGSLLQCAEPSLPGYLPSELFAGQTESFLKTITCQRCHFLKNYNTVIDVTVRPEEYVRLISSITDKFALVILMVDLTDFPCSIWPQIHEIIGQKRPVFVVGNKVDLLPRDSAGYLRHVKECLETAVELSGIPGTNIKHTCLISAETGFGIEELITKLHNVWMYKGDVYLLGCTNVGKSTLFNALLRSDYCKTKAASIIGKATASPWPGTTMRMLKFPILRPNDWRMYVRTKRLVSSRSIRLAEEQLRRDQAVTTKKTEHATLIGHIGNTFLEKPSDETNDAFSMGKGSPPVLQINEKHKDYARSKWCFDTPGVIQPEQTLNLLTTEELLLTIPKRMIRPRTFKLETGMSLLLAGMGRLDFLRAPQDPQAIRVSLFASEKLPVIIVNTSSAEEVYADLLGTEVLAVPTGDAKRLSAWPALEGKAMRVLGVGERVAACDILLSSAGWIGINIADGQMAHFKVWTPEGRGIVKRTPSLIPNAMSLCGKRMRGSLAYANMKSFV